VVFHSLLLFSLLWGYSFYSLVFSLVCSTAPFLAVFSMSHFLINFLYSYAVRNLRSAHQNVGNVGNLGSGIT
jgi:hypothetical protein